MTKNIAGVVIFFNPKREDIQTVFTYIDMVDKLYLIDNSYTPVDFFKLKEYEKIEVLSTSKNLGIAKALNITLRKALLDGYRWLLTMDQDSKFEKKELQKFQKDFDSFPKKNLAIYSPLHNIKFLENKHKEELIVMTSGNIVHIESLLKIGAFNESLFIDEVDHDMCLRVNKNSYKVVKNYNCYLTHTLGSDCSKNIKKYSSKRLYYMFRNYLYIRKKYSQDFPFFFKKRDKYLKKFFLQQFFFFSKKKTKFFLLCRAYYDYKNKNMGYQVSFDA